MRFSATEYLNIDGKWIKNETQTMVSRQIAPIIEIQYFVELCEGTCWFEIWYI